jgi:hypothetical protein
LREDECGVLVEDVIEEYAPTHAVVEEAGVTLARPETAITVHDLRSTDLALLAHRLGLAVTPMTNHDQKM